jgi:LysM repeat protein
LENRAAVAPARKQAATAKTSKVVVRYTVKVNDTLSQIAADHRLNSWQPLAAANTDIVKNPNLIWPGQRLRVPSSSQGDQAPEAQMPPSRQTSPVRQQPSQTIRTPQVQQPQPATGNGDPQSIARELLASNGWSDQWSCLNSLVNRESGWNIYAQNPSGAYGIPQSLPGSKMASMGSDWRTSALTQLRWMMQYLRDVYGGPCGAWGHSQRSNWY